MELEKFEALEDWQSMGKRYEKYEIIAHAWYQEKTRDGRGGEGYNFI